MCVDGYVCRLMCVSRYCDENLHISLVGGEEALWDLHHNIAQVYYIISGPFAQI